MVESANWEAQQQKTFTKWVNSHLRKRGQQINDLLTDFASGVFLCSLYEVISDEALSKYYTEPKNEFQKIANLDLVLKKINSFTKDAGIKVQYSVKQIMEGERRQILGMLWCLIHKFIIQDISEAELSAKDALLLWCQKQTKDQKYKDKGVDIKNFSRSWQDGLAFCALINKNRPDLLDFNSLNPNDAKANLQLAFDVADKELDISPLLDVDDLVNDIPDEKSVMTYVGQFWKKFNASDKLQKSAEKIGRIAQKQRELGELKAEYERRAQELVDRITRSAESVDDRSFDHFGNSLDKALQRKSEFAVLKQELPIISKERANLELLLNTIRAKQKSPPKFSLLYEPPLELAPSTIRDYASNLNSGFESYDLALRDHITEMKRLDVLYSRFTSRAQKIDDYQKAKIAKLTQETDQVTSNANRSELQAKLKIFDTTFGQEVAAVGRSIHATRVLANQIVNGKYEKAEEVSDVVSTLSQQQEQVRVNGEKYIEQVKENFKKLEEIVAKGLQLAKNLENLKLYLDDISLTLSEPVSSAQSISDVDSYKQTLDAIESEHASNGSLLEEAKQLNIWLNAEKLYNADDHQYSKETVSDIESEYNKYKAAIEERRQLLDTEYTKQKEISVVLNSFSAQTAEYSKFLEEQTEAFSAAATAKGSQDLEKLKENVEQLKKQAEQEKAKNSELYSGLQDILKRIEELDIVEQTKTTSNELATNFETLNQYVDKLVETAQQQVFMAEQATQSRENVFTDEVLNEFREVFGHFDKDRDGKLSKLEFKGSTAALGEDIEDSKLDAVFSQTDVDKDGLISYEEFLGFMKDILLKQAGDAKDDILNAFQQIASKKDENAGITEQELRSVLDSEQVEYLISVMPKNNDGSYNYRAFLNESFGEVLTPTTPVE